MVVTNTDNAVSVANKRYGRARKWLQRRIKRVVLQQTLRPPKEDTNIPPKPSLERPCTAPAIGSACRPHDIALIPAVPIDTKQTPPRPPIVPPVRPVRPDSSVVRDVNAWLEASTNTLSPPLMSGLSYWKEATVLGVKDSAVAQYAVPLSVATGAARPATAVSQPATYFGRSTMRVQAQMSLSWGTKSPHPVGGQHVNRQSVSEPPSAFPYEVARDDSPTLPTHFKPPLAPLMPPPGWDTSTQDGVLFADQWPRECSTSLHNTSTSASFHSAASDAQRHMNKTLMHAARGADSMRPCTAATGQVREGSMGDMSDAPTYFSGPPPPSYRSRRDSTVTTSSFGCIDGMNLAQRQISQQRAVLQRGVRCRLKRLAQNLAM